MSVPWGGFWALRPDGSHSALPDLSCSSGPALCQEDQKTQAKALLWHPVSVENPSVMENALGLTWTCLVWRAHQCTMPWEVILTSKKLSHFRTSLAIHHEDRICRGVFWVATETYSLPCFKGFLPTWISGILPLGICSSMLGYQLPASSWKPPTSQGEVTSWVSLWMRKSLVEASVICVCVG